jgi:uncharacterized membrane protein YjgN (DUF898 family)
VRSFFPLFLGLYIPSLVLYVVQFIWARPAPGGSPFSTLWITAACTAGIFLLYIFFAIPLLRLLIPAFSLQGKPLAFRGDLWQFVGMNILGAFLSLITIGVYAPWYITRVTRYLAAETSYDGRPWVFSGRGGRLFVILLLTLVVPILVISIVIGIVIGVMIAASGGAASAVSPRLATQIAVFLISFLILPAYFYEFYRWYAVNLRIGDAQVRWSTRFWPSVGTILLQMFLSVITLSVYFPAACVRLYAYFARRTSFAWLDPGREGYALGFDATPGGGFGLIWGQTLLSLITAGIYLPWAAVRIGGWFASHTTFAPQSENVSPSSSMAR